MIVLIGSRKGGAGKSTLASCIAVELAKRGDVLLIDERMLDTSQLYLVCRNWATFAPVWLTWQSVMTLW